MSLDIIKMILARWRNKKLSNVFIKITIYLALSKIYQDQQAAFLAEELREHLGVECNK